MRLLWSEQEYSESLPDIYIKHVFLHDAYTLIMQADILEPISESYFTRLQVFLHMSEMYELPS